MQNLIPGPRGHALSRRQVPTRWATRVHPYLVLERRKQAGGGHFTPAFESVGAPVPAASFWQDHGGAEVCTEFPEGAGVHLCPE